MLYTNSELVIETREKGFGNLTGIAIGERGRGRREIFLPTPKGIEEYALKSVKGVPSIKGLLSPGLYHHLTIGKTQSGYPRINNAPESNQEVYLVLSSKWRYTRRGDGYIMAPATQEVNLIARANGADGDAGRIGTWDALVLKANPGDVFRLTWGGSGYGRDPMYYVVAKDRFVYQVEPLYMESFYEKLAEDGEDAKMPFTLKFDDDYAIVPKEWKRV